MRPRSAFDLHLTNTCKHRTHLGTYILHFVPYIYYYHSLCLSLNLHYIDSSPNSNDLYIHYMDKSTGTPPSLDEKKALPNCGNKDGNINHVLKKIISTFFATVLKCMKRLYPYVQVIGVW